MKLSGNTILITGGTSGLGLEMVKRLYDNNQLIVCARNREKLEQLRNDYPKLITYDCDLSQEEAVKYLISTILSNHKSVNVIINNAAITHNTPFWETPDLYEMAKREFQTNVLAPLQLILGLKALLLTHSNPAIINIGSGLAYIPRVHYPIYNATKAALHSLSTVMRETDKTKIRVVEVLFPAVDTPWHQGNPPKIAISPQAAVDEMLKGLKNDTSVIRVGKVKLLYTLSRFMPKMAFRKLNAMASN